MSTSSTTSFLDGIIKIAVDNQHVADNDYYENGLLYCGSCNTSKQCKITISDTVHIVPCTCKCYQEKLDKLELTKQEEKHSMYIRKLKTNGVQDKQMVNWTFENDNGLNPKAIDKARRYFEKWDSMYEQNIGLLLWGGVGTGKSYSAACIANALIDNGVPALITSFTKIINELSGFEVKDRNAYIDSFNNYKLLVIDDLGAERQSDFALEIVFNIIDSRYKNGQPMIITTNINLEDIQTPKDIKYNRIYDRILEMCVPLVFKGESMRKNALNSKIEKAKELFK